MRERGLADARDVFEKNVALRQQRSDAELHDLGLAFDDTLDVRLQLGDFLEGAIDRYRLGCHDKKSVPRAQCPVPRPTAHWHWALGTGHWALGTCQLLNLHWTFY